VISHVYQFRSIAKLKYLCCRCPDYNIFSALEDSLYMAVFFICRYLRATALHLATEYEDVEEVQTNLPIALGLFDGWLYRGVS